MKTFNISIFLFLFSLSLNYLFIFFYHSPFSFTNVSFLSQLQHELFVVAESAGKEAHAIVQIKVLDVNDNAPYFVNPNPKVIVIEEDDRDLPKPLFKVRKSQLILYTRISIPMEI